LYIFFLELYTRSSLGGKKSTIVKPPGREKTRKGKSKWRDFESRHSFSVISKPKHIPKNIPKENFNCQFCTILEPQEE